MSYSLDDYAFEVPRQAFVAGHFVDASDDATFTVDDPATGAPVAQVADCSPAQFVTALDHAESAGKSWAATPERTRSEVLRAIFSAVGAHADDFATIMTLEMGKPFAEASGEVAYANEYFRWFSEQAVRLPGRFSQSPSGHGRMTVTHRPVGPVLAITPWNFPLAMATRKIAPALAAGCPIIVKPAHETPLTMLYLAKIIHSVFTDFDVAPGVVSVIPSTDAAGVSTTLMADPRLRKVTFTGSTPVGKILVRQSADQLQRTSMELGGNAPFVVAACADIDHAVEQAVAAKMRNGGQACIAANRFLVDENVAEEFTGKFERKMAAFTLGHGMDAATTLGPVITRTQRDRIASLVDDAVAQGATALTGGGIPDRPGYFYPATLLAGVDPSMRIYNEEIFGPVATVTTFRDLEEGIAMANDTPFGLAAYGFATDLAALAALRDGLEAGMIGINRGSISDPAAPFGGIKQSGFGREGSAEGIEEYLDTIYLAEA
ncbi:NAD-dependent succinate-semialdehyde dehydrogenase [Corynebacterium mendelii]|uniref:NAD-dependent succinate-semialdehyde dehydrogenase n=1 Tax=Corynebacterium mendelii TaxID=2765362 RepID=A0A939DXU7_9CORY|nr:NAD-dependent succinate-semialdehyde dehydrogenase [Corynebacterium mendelii]MBN9643224.1 NAD-dependent succinate-semialdehyde dehydrogenase [Corynebacterium mendelii]